MRSRSSIPSCWCYTWSNRETLTAAIALRDQLAPAVPVLLVAAAVDEAQIAQAIALGARDVVTLANEARLQAVMLRELRAFRTQQALDATLKSAHDARSQLETVLQRSNDAIIQVQEGIVVDANPAWLELFGVEDGVVGQPVMDLFEEATHAALRGALAACLQGRWSDHPLRANALLADGSVLPIEMTLDARPARVASRAYGWWCRRGRARKHARWCVPRTRRAPSRRRPAAPRRAARGAGASGCAPPPPAACAASRWRASTSSPRSSA